VSRKPPGLRWRQPLPQADFTADRLRL